VDNSAAVACGDGSRQLFPFREIARRSLLGGCGAHTVGEGVGLIAFVVCACQSLAPSGRRALGIEKRLHALAPFGCIRRGAERPQHRERAHDLGKPQELFLVGSRWRLDRLSGFDDLWQGRLGRSRMGGGPPLWRGVIVRLLLLPISRRQILRLGLRLHLWLQAEQALEEILGRSGGGGCDDRDGRKGGQRA
jgi:hypothetical protein